MNDTNVHIALNMLSQYYSHYGIPQTYHINERVVYEELHYLKTTFPEFCVQKYLQYRMKQLMFSWKQDKLYRMKVARRRQFVQPLPVLQQNTQLRTTRQTAFIPPDSWTSG